jgi:hypothetical protein
MRFSVFLLSHVGGDLGKADSSSRDHMSVNEIPKLGKWETLDRSAPPHRTARGKGFEAQESLGSVLYFEVKRF